MSDIKIKSESELLRFLKIVAEESYNKSVKTINEADDPAVSNYESNYRLDSTIYNLKEEEGDENIDDPFSIQEPAEDQAAEPEAEKEPVEASEPEPAGDDFAVSFDSIITAINTLRSGRSLKDKEVKLGVSQYYDRLSEEERMVMYTFLGALSKILTGAIDGSEAQDPGDAPLNFNITTADQEADKEAESDAEAIAPDTEQMPEEDDEGEDITPPIELAESQKVEALRKKVRKLMER